MSRIEHPRHNLQRLEPPPANQAAENLYRLGGSAGGLGDSLVKYPPQTPAKAGVICEAPKTPYVIEMIGGREKIRTLGGGCSASVGN